MISLLFTILVAEIWLWYALVSDLRHRTGALQAVVYIIKSLLSVALVYLVVRIFFYKGEFDDPANAYRMIVSGALGAFIVTAASVYLVIRLVTWLLYKTGKRKRKAHGLAGVIIFCALVALFADSYFRQRLSVKVVHKEIAIKGLDPRLTGMKIVLISDLHLSSWYGHYDRLSRIMKIINDEEPDLLINTGDFITYGWKEYGRCDTILVKAHATDGAFAVDGNHDDGTYHPSFSIRYSRENDDMLNRRISSSGYTLLRDTVVYIIHDSSRVAIAGISTHGHHFDISYGDFEHVLGQVPDSLFSILLLHAPDGWDQVLLQEHVPDLTLSGHTHGMQVGLPVPGGYISPASLIHKYWRGLYKKEDHYLYVTTGLGTMGMALRIFMPPEIAVLSLTGN
jgi:predicted MPP superfamily phosphohydrolase